MGQFLTYTRAASSLLGYVITYPAALLRARSDRPRPEIPLRGRASSSGRDRGQYSGKPPARLAAAVKVIMIAAHH